MQALRPQPGAQGAARAAADVEHGVAGLQGFSEALRIELAGTGVRVGVIGPGTAQALAGFQEAARSAPNFADAQATIRAREQKIATMQESFSWRVTSPLRALRRAFLDRPAPPPPSGALLGNVDYPRDWSHIPPTLNVRAASGASMAGFTIMVHPAAMAGPSFHSTSATGKFHGVMAAATPTGCRSTSTRRSRAGAGILPQLRPQLAQPDRRPDQGPGDRRAQHRHVSRRVEGDGSRRRSHGGAAGRRLDFLMQELNRQGLMRWYLHPAIDDTILKTEMIFEQEIPPGSRSGRIKFQGEQVIYVIEGRGHTLIDGVKHPWKAGDVINLPLRRDGIVVQHFNDDAEKPVRFIAAEPDPAHAVVGLRNHGITATGENLGEILDRIVPRLQRQVPMI